MPLAPAPRVWEAQAPIAAGRNTSGPLRLYDIRFTYVQTLPCNDIRSWQLAPAGQKSFQDIRTGSQPLHIDPRCAWFSMVLTGPRQVLTRVLTFTWIIDVIVISMQALGAVRSECQALSSHVTGFPADLARRTPYH